MSEVYDVSVLGYDVAGEVVEVGEEASTVYSIGDEVYVRLEGMKYGVSDEKSMNHVIYCLYSYP